MKALRRFLLLSIAWSLAFSSGYANALPLASSPDCDMVALRSASWCAPTKLNTATMAGNSVEAMPVFPYLLNAHLTWLCPVLGLFGLWLLFMGLRPKTTKAGE